MDVEQRGPGVFYVRLRPALEEPLNTYERRVLDHLRTRAVDDVVPAEALTTGPGSDELEQRFAVSYWEHIGTEGGAGVRDEVASAALFTLHNAVRARFYIVANIQIGGAFDTRYLGTTFPSRATGVRFFTLTIASFRHIHAV